MKIQSTAPTGQAQAFEVNETFFSTTDSSGVITDGNAVFCRTSGYGLPDMIGQPHNLIRHRDMPRVVFKRLWEAARMGRTFSGYVKNQARNGNHYWVYALIVPIAGGYVSVRIKPTSPLQGNIERLYARLLQREAQVLASGSSESAAALSAGELLDSELKALGFASYEAFSHHALSTEIKSRDAEISRRSLKLFPPELASADASLGNLYRDALDTYRGLDALFNGLEAFIGLRDSIRQRHDAVRDIAEEFRLNALNAHIAAHPLGERGNTLSMVAQILNQHGQALSRNVNTLAAHIDTTTTAIADVASNLASARILLEMLLSFLHEISAGASSDMEHRALLVKAHRLRQAFATTLDQAFTALAMLQRQMPVVVASKEELRKDIIYLQVAQISGLTEVSRVAEAVSLHATFTGLRDQIETGKRELEQLGEVVGTLTSLANGTPAQVAAIRESLRRAETAARPDSMPSAPPPSIERPSHSARAVRNDVAVGADA